MGIINLFLLLFMVFVLPSLLYETSMYFDRKVRKILRDKVLKNKAERNKRRK